MSNPHAVRLGRLGGLVRSLAKSKTSRINGGKGGRPVSAGLDNWERFFDAVDECRRTHTFDSLKKIYNHSRKPREKAIVNAAVRYLSSEIGEIVPSWAAHSYCLKSPYFVAAVENLKASALVESPADFRLNNVFVLENFLDRV